MPKAAGARRSIVILFIPLLISLFLVSITAFGQDLTTAASSPQLFTLDAYALRGPQDTSAKLYLTVAPANSQMIAPEELKDVLVRVAGTDGALESTNDYLSVSSPGGQTTIGLGDVPLLDTIAVQVLVQTPQTVDTEVLQGLTEVTEFAVNSRQVVVPNFEGYGAQMNSNLYTSLSNVAKGWINFPPKDVSNVETRVKEMNPGLCRIFLSPKNFLPGNENLQTSFIQTVQLAQVAGARINITWWYLRKVVSNVTNNPAKEKTAIDQDMQHFANTLDELIKTDGIMDIKEITIQNEPDSVGWIRNNMSMYQYAYRQLDTDLKQDDLRSQIKFVGGDLVHNYQLAFFTYMAQNMGDVLDGWSVHIYWNYWDPAYFVDRLNGILEDMTKLKGEGLKTKPLSVTEYGVRGVKKIGSTFIMDVNPYRNCTLTKTLAGYYLNSDGSKIPVNETNVAAFQQARFNMQAADYGFIGFSKWDFYRAQYDFSYQDHSLIGYLDHCQNPPPTADLWPLRPAYYMEWLMAHTTGQGWNVLGYHGSSGAKLIAPFRSPLHALTVFATNTNAQAAPISVGDLPTNTTFDVLVWNANGSGKVTSGGTINSGQAGAVSINLPIQGVVALTTVATGQLP